MQAKTRDTLTALGDAGLGIFIAAVVQGAGMTCGYLVVMWVRGWMAVMP